MPATPTRLVLQAIGGLLYFFASDGVNGNQLWRSDGTPGGTFAVSSGGVVPSVQFGAAAFTPAIRRDFNGDLRSDLLWQNSSGEIVVWELNGGSVIGGGSVGNPGPDWHPKATGDFNGDGRADILWQNDSGEVVIWALNGTA